MWAIHERRSVLGLLSTSDDEQLLTILILAYSFKKNKAKRFNSPARYVNYMQIDLDPFPLVA